MGQSNFTPPHRKGSCRSFNGRKKIDEMYNGCWERYRAKFLAINPQCYACGAKADVVDHIESHKGDVSLFWKIDNYIPLCFSHHNTVTSKFDRYHQTGNPAINKIKWLNDLRMFNEVSRKVKIVPFDQEIFTLMKNYKPKE